MSWGWRENYQACKSSELYKKSGDEANWIFTDPFSGAIMAYVSVHEHLMAIARNVNSLQLSTTSLQSKCKNSERFSKEWFADITVPFFPRTCDKVFIRGEGHEPWLAELLTIKGRSIPSECYTRWRMKTGQGNSCTLHIPLFVLHMILFHGVLFCVQSTKKGKIKTTNHTCNWHRQSNCHTRVQNTSATSVPIRRSA